jgi:serine/threonine protein kinase
MRMAEPRRSLGSGAPTHGAVPPRLLSTFHGVPDMPLSSKLLAQAHVAASLSRSLTGLSASQREHELRKPRTPLPTPRAWLSQPPSSTTPRARLSHALSAERLSSGVAAASGRTSPLGACRPLLRSSSSIPPRHSVRMRPAGPQMGPTALSLSLAPAPSGSVTTRIPSPYRLAPAALGAAGRGGGGGGQSCASIQAATMRTCSPLQFARASPGGELVERPAPAEVHPLAMTMPALRSITMLAAPDGAGAGGAGAGGAGGGGGDALRKSLSMSLLPLSRIPSKNGLDDETRVENDAKGARRRRARALSRARARARVPRPPGRASSQPLVARAVVRACLSRAALNALSLRNDASRPAWAIDSCELLTLERVGVGTYGQVFRGSWRGADVALKKLRPDHKSSARALAFLSEMQLMAGLHHPHVVAFLAGVLEQGAVCMVHALCLCSLHDVLHAGAHAHGSLQIPLAVQLKWAREVALGVAYLHAQRPPLLHRDLKSANVLLSHGWAAQLGDFGAARALAHGPAPGGGAAGGASAGGGGCEASGGASSAASLACALIETSRPGTCQWSAPEVLRGQPHDERCDSYAFGILLYELAARRRPYEGLAQQQVEVAVITGKLPRPDTAAALRGLLPTPPESVLEPLVALARACVDDDFTRRPRFHQIETELQSAQNLLVRDTDMRAYLGRADRADPAHTDGDAAARERTLADGAAPAGRTTDSSEFARVADKHLRALLAESRALAADEAGALEASRRTSARASASDSDADSSDAGSSDDEGAAGGARS